MSAPWPGRPTPPTARSSPLIECNNEEAKQENANKNPVVNSVQRDYMAGEVSKDITQRLLLPRHRGGPQGGHHPLPRHGLLRPAHAQLRSGQPGGHAPKRHRHLGYPHRKAPQLFHRLQHRHPDHRPGGLQPVRRPVHLPGPPGPFVQVSREKIRGQVLAEIAAVGGTPSEEVLSGIVEKRLREEIRRGVQTIQYQVVTLMTTNGQAPSSPCSCTWARWTIPRPSGIWPSSSRRPWYSAMRA